MRLESCPFQNSHGTGQIQEGVKSLEELEGEGGGGERSGR